MRAMPTEVREITSSRHTLAPAADPPPAASGSPALLGQPIVNAPAPIIHCAPPSLRVASPGHSPIDVDRADSPGLQAHHEDQESDKAEASEHDNSGHDSDIPLDDDPSMMLLTMSQMAQMGVHGLSDSEVARLGLPPGIYVDFSEQPNFDGGESSAR